MKNCKGYVFLEMLSAFSICLFVVFAILPIVTDTVTERRDILLRMDAYSYLYDSLAGRMNGNERQQEDDRNDLYFITWRDAADYPMLLEGCVHYENHKGKTEKVCDWARK